jgi:hypothetical protein
VVEDSTHSKKLSPLPITRLRIRKVLECAGPLALWPGNSLPLTGSCPKQKLLFSMRSTRTSSLRIWLGILLLGFSFCWTKAEFAGAQEAPAITNALGSTSRAASGFLFAQAKRPAAALAELELASQSPARDLISEWQLANGYAILNLFQPAKEHFVNYLRLAHEQELPAATVAEVEALIATMDEHLTMHYVTAERPPKTIFLDSIQQNLTREERQLAVNPLDSNSAMGQWAKDITATGTNAEHRARLLFETILRRQNEHALQRQPTPLTAQEVFSQWKNAPAAMQCQEVTFLFVSLARSVGLEAYATTVEENFAGGKSPHACAALFLGGRALLVDPNFGLFGAPHKRFTVLNDVRACAEYLCEFTDLKRARIAAKLAPESFFVQCRLAYALMEESLWTEAEALMPILVRLGAEGAMTKEVLARLADHRGETSKAIQLLEEASKIDPAEGGNHLTLGCYYHAAGQLARADESLQKALNCQLNDQETKTVSRLLKQWREEALHSPIIPTNGQNGAIGPAEKLGSALKTNAGAKVKMAEATSPEMANVSVGWALFFLLLLLSLVVGFGRLVQRYYGTDKD